MFTIRNLGGAALVLAGTTWPWLTPMFATKGVTTSGFLWTATQALSLLTIGGLLSGATVGAVGPTPVMSG